MNNDFQGSSRFNYRAKRKKTNLILNSSIVIVVLLIGFVAYSIFFSGNDNATSQKSVQTSSNHQSSSKIKKDKSSASTAAANSNDNSTASSQSSDSTATQDNGSNSTTDTAQGNSSSQDLQVVQNPDSNTATSAQSGAHTPNYDSSSADWQQMLQAISTATGIDQSNMTVEWLGSDKSTPGGSVGTVYPKNNSQQKYQVSIQWNGQGYTATKVEQVAQ